MAALLDLHKDASWYDHELSEIVTNSCDNICLLTALAQDLEDIYSFQSLQANSEAAVLMEYPLIAAELLQKLDHAYAKELLMKERCQSFDNGLDEKIECVDAWKKVCIVFFTAATAISAAVAATNANSNTAAAAAASAATVLFGAAGNWIHSLMKKHESDVVKRKEVIDVMIRGGGSSVNYMSDIHVLGIRLQSEAKFVLKMVDGRADVGEEVAELNNIFQELRGKVNDYGPNMNRAIEDGLRRIITDN